MALSSNATKVLEKINNMSESNRVDAIISICENYSSSMHDSSLFRYFLKNYTPIVKWHAIKALGDICAEDAVDDLIDVYKESDVSFGHTSLYSITAYSLGKIGDASLDKLYTLLNNPNQKVVLSVIDAIGEISSPSSIKYLVTYLEEKYSVLSSYAALALGKIGKSSISELERVSKSCDEKTLIVITDELMMIDELESYEVIYGICQTAPRIVRSLLLEQSRNAKSFLSRINSRAPANSYRKDIYYDLADIINRILR